MRQRIDLKKVHSMNESQVFAEALKIITPTERAAYLDSACIHRPQLREDVEALLRAHATDPGFLEEPAVAPGLTAGSARDALDQLNPERGEEDLGFLAPTNRPD